MSSILVFSTQHMPTGGIESHLLEFCTRLHQAGVTIDLVITNSQMRPETEKTYRSLCRTVFLGKNRRAPARLAWLFSVGLIVGSRRYDAFYSNGQGESIRLFSRLARRRRTWVHHHHTAGDALDQATWGPKYRETLRRADIVIACSGSNARALEKAVGRSIDSIPCFSRNLSGVIKKHEKPLKLGYYGRLIPEKGIATLCRFSAETEFQNVEFHIWGEGEAFPESFFQGYPQLHFHGPFFGKDALAQIVSQLDAYLLISTHPEGLPIALLEVMSAGLPWLATDKGGVFDIACDPQTTRVIPADASYLETKRAVLELVEDLTNGRLQATLQKQIYAENFAPAILVQRWQNALFPTETPSPASVRR